MGVPSKRNLTLLMPLVVSLGTTKENGETAMQMFTQLHSLKLNTGV